MPLIRVSHPADAFTPQTQDKLAEGLTALLLDIEGGRQTPGGRTLAYVVFVPVERQNWYVGGSNGPEHQKGAERVIVDITVPEASTTQAQKSDAHRRVHAILAEALNWPLDEANINAWVIVHEVPEGHWGARGETFGLREISSYAGGPHDVPDPVRVDFVERYFRAKAAARSVAGYPKEASGLLRA